MEKDHSEEIGKMTAGLAVIEVGLGSLLHSFKVPLSGHFLSINQIAILSRSSFQLRSKKAALEISLVASLLKSLSPAGKKLTPMLAIAAQGVLYYVGLVLLGFNPIGLLLGCILSSSWAFIQPVMFIYLLFGQGSIEVVQYFLNEANKVYPHADAILLKIIILFFIFKCFVSYIVSILAIRMSNEKFTNFQKRMFKEININKPESTAASQSPFRMAIKDLFNPLFIVSFIFTSFYFIFSEASFAKIIWEMLRPLATGFILFYFFRIYPLEKISLFLEKKGFSNLSKSLDKAIAVLKEIKFLK